MSEAPSNQAAEDVQPHWGERIRGRAVATLRSESFQRWAMLVAISLIIAALAYSRLIPGGRDYQVGDVATEDVKASRDFLVEDRQSTEVRREAAAEAAPPVYDIDEEALAQAIRRLNTAMARAREMEGGRSDPDLLHAERTEFERLLGAAVDAKTFRALRRGGFDPQVERAALTMLSRVMVAGVGRVQHQQPIVVRAVVAGQERQVEDPSSIPTPREARAKLKERAKEFAKELPAEQLAAAVSLAQTLVVPNLTFNKAETELRRARAKERVRPVFFQVKKGEMIVREGEKVRPEDLLKLKVEREGSGAAGPEIIIGMALLLGIFLAITYHIAELHGRKSLVASNKDLLFLCATLLLIFLTARSALFIGEAVSDAFPFVTERTIVYGTPVAAGAMMVALFLGLRQAIFFSMVAAVSVAMLAGSQLAAFLFFFIGSLVGAASVGKVRERPALVRAGLVVGVTNMLVVAALSIGAGTFFSLQGPLEAFSGLAGGLAAGVLVVGLTPVVEMLFGYVTDMRLLELTNFDQPLLRELMVQSPGTYHHSVVVANMVEAAAEPIGANALLAKVSAFYHDLGKTRKPQYFVENQADGVNRHEKLTPSMSALILTSHVKDGAEMAAAAGLEQRIVDIIRQHHGTALISYFYQKAKTLKGDGAVSEADYRYPGPKPQTKEAGLVMLADAVEAACRTLPEPTADRIQGLVQRIINNIFCDGQLDESELTLRDLHSIAASFNKILCAMYHQRVEYPEAERVKRRSGEARGEAEDSERAAGAEDQPGGPEEKERQNIRRLGLS